MAAVGNTPGKIKKRLDCEQVDSHEKVRALVRAGKLKKVLLKPIEFGGSDTQLNTVYLPVDAADQKNNIDQDVVRALIEQKKVSRYLATPRYHGKSYIPTAICVEAFDPVQFQMNVAVWGGDDLDDEV